MRRFLIHGAVWLALFVFWFFVSRNNHPTGLIDALATAILLLASAVCFYWQDLILRPWLLGRGVTPLWGRVLAYAGCLALTILVLDFAAVVAIQGIYDRLWGPDPARFGFWTNVLYEALFIGLHLAIGGIVAAVVRRRRS